jgi:hypothetical protein
MGFGVVNRNRDSNQDQVGNPDVEILRAIHSLRFGSVEVVIHNGQVVQIEKKEKVRFEKSPEPHPSK